MGCRVWHARFKSHTQSWICSTFHTGRCSSRTSNSTPDEIQSGDVVTTTSAPISISVGVDRRQVTNFETYYQTFANSLRITLEPPRTEDEKVDPGDPSAEVPSTWGPEPEFRDDEEPWVPWEKKPASEMTRSISWGTYSGIVPVVVRPIRGITPPGMTDGHIQWAWPPRNNLHNKPVQGRSTGDLNGHDQGCGKGVISGGPSPPSSISHPMRVAWHLLGFLPLLGPNGVHADILLPECSLQGWVRAPDLSPDTIIQGDARLKLTARCTAVESASLGLRFKERSFVKASRSIEATKRPTREQTVIDIFDPEHNSPSSPWVPPVHDSFNCSADIAFELIVKNKDLWLVKEEERIVFESTQGIDMGEAQPGSVRDVVRDFAILVPSTNFPPALHYPRAQVGWREGEFVNVEAMYEYFVRVAFANGTRVEIPVGFTAFHPLYDPPSNNVVRSKTVQLQTKESLDGSPVDNDPVANYTAEISSKRDGFAFSQGADDQFIKVAITRTGRARTFVEPLNLHLCIDSTLSPKWAPEHNPTLQSLHKPNQILRATSADFKMLTSPSTSRCIRNQGHTREPKPVPMPNATADQIAAAAIVTMTSKPVHFLIGADPRHATDFETYYHTLSSALFLSLDVPRTQDEPPNPEDMFELRAMRKKMPEVGVDEEAWVPWTNVPEVAHWRAHRTYTGNVSVSVYPAHEAQLPPYCVMRTTTGVAGTDSEQVVVGDSADCALRSPVHYLAKGARAPTFVDGGAAQVQALLSKTAAERDAFAPLLEPVVSSPPEGEERVHRYYRVPEGHRPLIYVGETWVKKVAHSDDHKVTAPRPDTIPTALAQMAAAMRHMFDEL